MSPFLVLLQPSPGEIALLGLAAPSPESALVAAAHHLSANGQASAVLVAVFDEPHVHAMQQQIDALKARIAQGVATNPSGS